MKRAALLPRPLRFIGWRYLRKHLWQSTLMVIGIVLGVSVVVGIDLANESSSRAFDLSTQAITGRTTHYLSAGSQGIDETLYVDLRLSGFEVPMAPIITEYVTVPQMDGITMQILGIDPFAERPFRNYLETANDFPVNNLSAFLTNSSGVIISKDLADRYAVKLGDRFELIFAGNNIAVDVLGILQPSDNLTRQALEGILLVDLATAQEITGKLGRVDRVDFIFADSDNNLMSSIEDVLPEGVQLLAISEQNGIIEQMTAAFRLNLTALSLLALVVALFLIYNTMTFSIIQRRAMFGTLRSLGVTRREVFLMVVSEATIIGLVGSILGLLGGIVLGRGLVGLVSQTISDLFFVSTVREVSLPLSSLIKGGLLGVLATVVTAAFPAWEAASVPPRTALSRANLESKAQRVVRWLGVSGLLMIGFGAAILAIPTKNLIVSFGGTIAVVFGFAMLTPIFTIWFMALSRRITVPLWGFLGRMAPREVVNSISRTSVAVAALMVAVAVTIGVSLMVGSFRFTVVTWLEQILHGDIYISVPGATVSQPIQPLNPQVLSILENQEGVDRVDLLQNAVVDSPNGPIQISANNNPNDGFEQIYLATEYPPERTWEAVEQGAVLVSEPLANRLDLPLSGGELPLYTPMGLQIFPVAGIYYDYASTQGNAILSLDQYRRIWGDEQIAAAALILEPNSDVRTIVQDLEASLPPIQSLLVRSNQTLRADTLEIFDRTFAITGALQLMTTFVAFVGVLSAMMSLQLDKQRQLGILKAIGLTARQLWTLIALETGLMGAVAGILAMPTGYILALILVFIINRRSFGWTLQMQITPEPFLQALVVAVTAALLAGLYPAYRIIRRNTAEAIRFD